MESLLRGVFRAHSELTTLLSLGGGPHPQGPHWQHHSAGSMTEGIFEKQREGLSLKEDFSEMNS